MQKASELLSLLARVETIPDPGRDMPQGLVPLRKKFWQNMRFVRAALEERGVEATKKEAASIWLMYLNVTHNMHTPGKQGARWAADWFVRRMGDYRILLRHPAADVRLTALAALEEQHRDWAEAYLQRALADLPAVLAALDEVKDVLDWRRAETQEVIVQMAVDDPDTAVRAKAVSLLPHVSSSVLTGERLREVVSAALAAEAWPVREALMLAVAFRVGSWSGEEEVRLAVDVIRQGLQDVHMVQLAAAKAMEVLLLRARTLAPEDWEGMASQVVERWQEMLPVALNHVLAAYSTLGAQAAPFFRRLALAEDIPIDLRVHGVYGYLMAARDEAVPEVRSLWDVQDLHPVILAGLVSLATEAGMKAAADLLTHIAWGRGPWAALAALEAAAEIVGVPEVMCRALAGVSETGGMAAQVARRWLEGRVEELSRIPACRPYLARLLSNGKGHTLMAAWALGYPPKIVEKWV